MRILYIGDVMAAMGVATVQRVLPHLRITEHIDLVIAQAENVTHGKGLGVEDYQQLRSYGVDGFTGGNHTLSLKDGLGLLKDVHVPVTGPSNMHHYPGPTHKYLTTPKGRVLIISILGKIVGRDSEKPVHNPLKTIDEILESQADEPRVATIVNFHGDFSSEKVVFGHYVDGRVAAMIGDHWHVPTADGMILPGGTAYQTDAGMCGSLDSSLGVTFDSIIPRWRDGTHSRNKLESTGRTQFNAVLVTTDDESGLATDIKPIRQIFED
jgi:metallophosphoesterase (TIGR00282 family)